MSFSDVISRLLADQRRSNIGAAIASSDLSGHSTVEEASTNKRRVPNTGSKEDRPYPESTRATHNTDVCVEKILRLQEVAVTGLFG